MKIDTGSEHKQRHENRDDCSYEPFEVDDECELDDSSKSDPDTPGDIGKWGMFRMNWNQFQNPIARSQVENISNFYGREMEWFAINGKEWSPNIR
jgi:hypothetical protein